MLLSPVDPTVQKSCSVFCSTFIEDDGDILFLRMSELTEADAGTYTCKGVVDGVEEEASIGLEVYCECAYHSVCPLNEWSIKSEYIIYN